jgi:hypothetical protein
VKPGKESGVSETGFFKKGFRDVAKVATIQKLF